jgi:N-acetylmuramic acid 6-phosphate etherase
MLNNDKSLNNLTHLISEQQNPNTLDIDQLSSFDIVKKINQEDHQVSEAIEKILPQVAETVELIVEAFNQQGRLIYIGAGTSGRLGVLDAAECVPTFNSEPEQVMGLIAGGEKAMFVAQEGAEDDPQAGADDLAQVNLTNKDIVVGLAASGRTPYVIGGLSYANKIGAKTIAISCNPKAEISEYADVSLLPIVGAEALTGSTRMKAGTAQKMLLNMLTTASMIRIGKTYGNLMVDLRATNQKLHARSLNIIMQVTGVEKSVAEKALEESGKHVKLAILMLLKNIDAKTAQAELDKANGFLAKAL